MATKYEYAVTISNRTDIRQGWRVACFTQPTSMNDRAVYVHNSNHRTEAAARKAANAVAKVFKAEILGN